MQCTACGHENPAGAQFCNGCGTALSARCAACGESNQPAARFCNQCRAALQVAEQVDPEEWHRILDRFFQILTDSPSAEGFGPQAGGHRSEGTLNQYTGDGILALLGAPITHADHARRACCAPPRLNEDTARLVEGLFRLVDLGLFTVRGVHAPVHAVDAGGGLRVGAGIAAPGPS